MKRRERTRQLIELGGLVAKAGLVELTDDDRAVIYGLLVACADTLRSERRDEALSLWQRRGRRAFDQSEADSPNIDWAALMPRGRRAALPRRSPSNAGLDLQLG